MSGIADIFRDPAFSLTTLSEQVIERVDYMPTMLEDMGLFKPYPIRDKTFAIESIDRTLRVVETTARGSAPKERDRELRDLRTFRTVQLSEKSTIYYDELTGIRELGKADQRKQVRSEIKERLQQPKDDLALTREHHRLGALQGILLDADGTSVINNYYDDFGLTPPAAVTWNLSNVDLNIRQLSNTLKRSIGRSTKGARATGYAALAGDEFYDALTTHPQVERAYNFDRPERLLTSTAWDSFVFGGIKFYNYRGTDDNSTVAVDNDKAIVFPLGTNFMKEVMSPAHFEPYINTKGKREYVLPVHDMERKSYSSYEVYSYPLFINTRPDIVRTITL